MTRALCFLQRLIAVRYVSGHAWSGVLKKTADSGPRGKKLQTICNPVTCFLIDSDDRCSDDQSNFNSALLLIEIMPEMERPAGENPTGDDERCQVEYLETPVKSENDKKEYR